VIEPKEALAAFPFLASVPRESRDAFLSASTRMSLKGGQILVSAGNQCGALPLVLDGTLRIYKVSEGGREMTLYRIERGESCVLTATCILNHGSFPAVAQAEGPTVVALAPAPLFLRMVEEHPQWRRFVFGLYAKRLDAVLTLVEEVAFRHVDERVAALLLTSPASGNLVRTTHAEIASEIGTSREVVSRILKDFEAQGLVTILRGGIRVLDPDGLEKKTGPPSAV
jgi:CRP/FNR family transcriptional regulator, anaerobic regulatory protein